MNRKHTIFAVLFALSSAWGWSQSKIQVTMDLNKVTQDQVTVTVKVPVNSASTLLYSVPKIIPGTYSEDDYGKYIEQFKALDAN